MPMATVSPSQRLWLQEDQVIIPTDLKRNCYSKARARARGGSGALGTADFSFASLADGGSTPSFFFFLT